MLHDDGPDVLTEHIFLIFFFYFFLIFFFLIQTKIKVKTKVDI